MTDSADDKPMIYGPDGLTPARADEPAPTAVIFAELVPRHIKNAGLVHDEQRAKAPQPELVAVKLPANCVLVEPDAQLVASGNSYLMKLATRAVAIVKGRGSVRMSVADQVNYAHAVMVLFQELNNQRVRNTQLAGEFSRMFEAHADYQAKMEKELADRDETFLSTVRQAYLDGIADECDVCGEAGDDFEAGLQRAADKYMKRMTADPEPQQPQEVASEGKDLQSPNLDEHGCDGDPCTHCAELSKVE